MVMKRAGDEGAGTLWLVAFTGVMWVSVVAALTVGGVRVAWHRADAAAYEQVGGATAHAERLGDELHVVGQQPGQVCGGTAQAASVRSSCRGVTRRWGGDLRSAGRGLSS
ncbi:hypothetical protein GCM10022214_53740 [Actinomadura miaoliensis]|uniref:Flp pilus-assembly TadG-like N-terminal domain-containing protein n=1 Tax=Actinomadura miaoliensis TaxID=430685 RepID=A0ABP7WDV6_9ACTN